MRLYSKKAKELKKLQKQMEAEAAQLIGKILVWKTLDYRYGRDRKYSGRACIVRQATVSDDGEIIVLVNTQNAQGNGFINNNDRFHRTYRGLNAFEPLETLPSGLERGSEEED